MRRIWIVAAVLAWTSFGQACGSESTTTRTIGHGVCDPGLSVECRGPAGCVGGQVCNDDGSGWGDCLCTEPDAGPLYDGAGVNADSGTAPGKCAYGPCRGSCDRFCLGRCDGRTSSCYGTCDMGQNCVGANVYEYCDGRSWICEGTCSGTCSETPD